MIDADSILEPDGLLRVARPFADDPTRMVATGGTIRPVNGAASSRAASSRRACRSRGFRASRSSSTCAPSSLGRTGWSRLGGLILISGAFGLFRRDVVVEVGGLDPDSIGEDFELVHAHPPASCATRGATTASSSCPSRSAGPRCPSTRRGAAQPAAALAPRPLGDAVGLPRR